MEIPDDTPRLQLNGLPINLVIIGEIVGRLVRDGSIYVAGAARANLPEGASFLLGMQVQGYIANNQEEGK